VTKEPTTPDLLELVRRSLEAVNERDYDRAMTVFAPGAVWDTSPIGLGAYEGREAVRKFFEDWIGTFEEWEVELEELRDLGNGVVFYVQVHSGRPAGGTGFLELRHGYTATWADGLIEAVVVQADIDEARAAAERLAEQRRWAVSQESS
jgi:ketosteroid isomerase-like protein